MSQTEDSGSAKDCTWTESEEQVLLEQAVIKGKVNWDNVAKLLPGKTSDDCRDHFNTVLNQREPTADEISKFRNLYLLNFDNVWKTSLQSPEGKPWENLTNRRTSTIKCDWYMRVRKTMWRSIAASVNCPWGVVEKMFLKLDEEERAGNMGVAVADL